MSTGIAGGLRDKIQPAALVLRKDMKRKKRAGGKMDFKWQGPYKVVKSVGKGIFQIINTNDSMQTLKVHGMHLKMFYPPKKVCAYVCMCLCSGNMYPTLNVAGFMVLSVVCCFCRF